MDKPILLLDIDGVLNPVGVNAPVNVWPADQWIETTATDDHGLTWKVRAARPVVEFFRRLHEMDVADMRWHTAWQQSANRYGAAVGMPSLPRQRPLLSGSVRRSKYWKLDAISDLAMEGHRVMWVDDEPYGSLAWKIINCCPISGLSKRNLRTIADNLGTSYEEVMGMNTSRP